MYRRGVELARGARIDEAISVFRDLVLKSPYYSLGHYGLGKSYLMKRGKLKEAIRHLKFSVELDRRFVKGYFYLGLAYYLSNNYFNALKYYDLAYRNDETLLEAIFNMGILYDSIGNGLKARIYYAKYFELLKKKGDDRVF